MKPLTFAICVTILAMLTVGTSGCTSFLNTTTSGSASPSPPPDNLASAIDNFYKQKNYTVNLPCSMTKKGDTVTYQVFVAVTLGGSSTNVTVVLTTNKTAANEAYDIADANLNAYKQSHPNSYHTALQLTPPGKVSSLVLWGYTTTGYDYLNVADMSEYYQVTSAIGPPPT